MAIVLSLLSAAFTFTPASSTLHIVSHDNTSNPKQAHRHRPPNTNPIPQMAKSGLFMIDDKDKGNGSSDMLSPLVDVPRDSNAESFQSYLGPYMVAAVCSLLATFAFVKLVLLDY